MSALREIHLFLPKDVLQSLLRDRQPSVSFQTDELGFPLRIHIWGAPPRPRPRIGATPEEKE